MQHLRLDMYINDKEYCAAETDATAAGFEAAVCSNWIIFERVANEIKATGSAQLTADEISDPEMQDILWDITDRETPSTTRIDFCICLWDDDEHLKSAVRISEFA